MTASVPMVTVFEYGSSQLTVNVWLVLFLVLVVMALVWRRVS